VILTCGPAAKPACHARCGSQHGHPAAVVISVEDLESLEETLDIMDSTALLADLRESLTELATAKEAMLSKEDALRLISGQ
jgi:antitoxin YefM